MTTNEGSNGPTADKQEPERDYRLTVIDEYIVRFAKENPAPHSRRDLARLVKAIGTLPEFRSLMREFQSTTLYPTRPMIECGYTNNRADVKKADVPVIWLLGWRLGEQTPIHDHVLSEVGIHIAKGEIRETIYWPELGPGIKYDKPLEAGIRVQCRTVSREILEGSTVQVPAPYIHKFEGADANFSVSIHAYWPRLEVMNYYEMTDYKQILVHTGQWKDEG